VVCLFIIAGLSILHIEWIELKKGEWVPFLVFLQVFVASSLIYYLCMVLDFYGVCGTYTLFVASHACQVVFWQALSPITKDIGRGAEFEGSLTCLVHLLFAWEDKYMAVYETLFRRSQPNLMNLAMTIFVFVLMTRLHGARVKLPLRSPSTGTHGSYSIKLLYTAQSSISTQVSHRSNMANLVPLYGIFVLPHKLRKYLIPRGNDQILLVAQYLGIGSLKWSISSDIWVAILDYHPVSQCGRLQHPSVYHLFDIHFGFWGD
jgi:preprotein translocase subunit SecY